ncbi:hypothetical protein ACIOMM_32110 [Streptomyces sp. NPDC087908]|uniref:hypothetical protein n=1 Tax=Streptomyces sp. NPDC087908 TaxID=3365820 RepID=UPI00380E155E
MPCSTVAARAGLAHLLVVGTGEGADAPAATENTPEAVGAFCSALLLPADVLLVEGAHAVGLESVADQPLTV